MIYLSAILVILICFLSISIQQECSPAGLKRFDEITSRATIFGNINLKFPENSDDVKEWCKNTLKHISEAESYNKKCNKQLFRQIYGIFIFAFRNTLKHHCKANSKVVNKFIESTPCFNRNKKEEVKCYTKWTDDILGAQNSEENKKIPYLCCGYLNYLDCNKKQMADLNGCDTNKVETMNGFTRSYLDNVLNFICGDYTTDNDKCSKLGDPPKRKKSQRRTKTIALPTADLLVSFKEI